MTKKILIIEDEKEVSTSLKMMLEDLCSNAKIDVSIDIIENGSSAKQKYLENNYDLITLDFDMPFFDGAETYFSLPQDARQKTTFLTYRQRDYVKSKLDELVIDYERINKQKPELDLDFKYIWKHEFGKKRAELLEYLK